MFLNKRLVILLVQFHVASQCLRGPMFHFGYTRTSNFFPALKRFGSIFILKCLPLVFSFHVGPVVSVSSVHILSLRLFIR
jgi:hypothetical protein